MTKIAIITPEEHRLLYGKELRQDIFFNPFLDKDGNICISEQEIELCDKSEFDFIKTKTLKEPEEILKDLTKEEWLEQDKIEYEKRLQEINLKLENTKK